MHATTEGRATHAQQRVAPQNVIGYSAVLIDARCRDALGLFRTKNLPVDLRIERSMVSAALELMFERDDVRSEATRQARELIASERALPAAGLARAHASGHVPGHVPVLVRTGLKHRVRSLGFESQISDQIYEIERAVVTSTVGIVIAAQELHARWIELISSTVGWEVTNSYSHRANA
jgi:hypothetical protein